MRASSVETIPQVETLSTGWTLAFAEAGVTRGPWDAQGLSDWIEAQVPGTVAGALVAAGRMRRDEPIRLHDKDVWFRRRLEGFGRAILRFEGLATLACIYLDGDLVAESRSMFLPVEVEVSLAGSHDLMICFAALGPFLDMAKGPRARWRTAMITPGSLRFVRTTPLGHMAGWSAPIDHVGPWRAVQLVRETRQPTPSVRALTATLEESGEGRLTVLLDLANWDGTAPTLVCAGRTAKLSPVGDGAWRGEVRLPGVTPWWPHTHGEPTLHDAWIEVGGGVFQLGLVGFRRITVDRGPDGEGFALCLNGERIFCRGASFTPPDPLALSCEEADILPTLELAREAGMNMLRVAGSMIPQGPAFHAACDRLGIMVWQEMPFANFDFPTQDPSFAALIEAEARAILGALQTSPSCVVLCGGSEMAQQASMTGLAPEKSRDAFFEVTLPALAAEILPGLPYVPHSPGGGDLPFEPRSGVTHYFGVGAYERPLEDARRAGVRFATECLAFANLPAFGALGGIDPLSGAGVPRDAGATWDFADTREHYLRRLYGVDPAALRQDDPERYAALGRAVTAEVMEAVFAEWRRAGSTCAGGLVWFLRDMIAGAGWGVLDAQGEPKSVWHALRRAFRPVQIALTDEGLNGLDCHLINETGRERTVRLTLTAFSEAGLVVGGGETSLTLGPRSTRRFSSSSLLGRFVDITAAYRFGPPAHEACIADLIDADSGALLARAVHVLPGHALEIRDIGLDAALVEQDGAPAVRVQSRSFARFVTFEDLNFRPKDDGFCLAPGEERVVSLVARRPGMADRPRGNVRALNSVPVAFGDRA